MNRPITGERSKRWHRTLIALNATAVVSALTAVTLAPAGNRIAVVAPPWSEPGRAAEIVASAGGSLVSGGAADWIVITEASEPGFVLRLMTAGAMVVLNGRLGEACLTLTRGQ